MSVTQGQIPIRAKGQDKCIEHQFPLVFYCKDCSDLVCLECITSSHKRHDFEKLSDIAANKRQIFDDYVIKTDKEIPNIEKEIKHIDIQIKENSNHFHFLSDSIKCRGEKLKSDIDRITKEFLESCEFIEQQNLELLIRHKKELQSLCTRLSEKRVICIETLKSESDVIIIDVEKEIQPEIEEKHISPQLQSVHFTTGQYQDERLRQDVGALCIQTKQGFNLQKEMEPVTVPTSDVSTEYKLNVSTVVSHFKHSSKIASVQKVKSHLFAVSHNENKSISLVNPKGEVWQTIDAGSNIQDISVSPATGNLWFCCFNNTVYEVLDTSLFQRFTFEQPWSLCVRANDVLVVGTSNNLTTFSDKGQVLYSTKSSGKHIVASPWHIAVDTNSGDIAVCDKDWLMNGGVGKPHVTILDSKLALKYQYYGPSESIHGQIFDFAFNPYDAIFDLQGRLLIGDHDNKCIQLVSSEGQFLTLIYIDAGNPTYLTNVLSGLLCICFNNNAVKFINYKDSIVYKSLR